ncbi:MAG TPA: M20/M25/M40 family metallo-hydrolase, partial [Pseudolabrys sp.]
MQASVALTQDLVRFRTINPPGDERACAERLASLLEGAGFAVDVVPFGNGRAQLVARIGGAAGKPPLGFTGHLDTVPLGAQPWSVDPFAAEILDGKLYGRGSSDMKSGVAAFVAACVALADKLAGTAGVVLLITAGEETGCTGAADRPEPGRRFLRSARLSWRSQPATMRWLATRERYGLKRSRPVSPRTAQCPKKASTRFTRRRAITALQDFDFNFARHDVLGGPTLNVGTIHGGLNINSVPDRAAIGIDIRTIPGQSHAKIRDQLASYLG